MPSVIIHGHFYQPPRENPWLDEVERERSAAPAHDWNERIERECYRPVAAARLPAADGRIARIVNTYAWISYNFGPTLLEWLEGAAPATYHAVLEADRLSAARLGHGNAVAMPYHHAILPLSTRREKVTEVAWGIADFRRRFGREPEGMWLPETAVDEETLDVLAEAGIKFTILAPSQVEKVPPHGLPGVVRTSGGRSIALFLYDGPISHDVAFGPLVRDGNAWARRLLAGISAGATPSLVSAATDGETYGHHHRFGEMALVSALDQVSRTPGVTIDNYASFLARHPATHPVTLVSPSAWSCTHGVERWRSNCGCKMAPDQPTQQAWRTPLRASLGWLTQEIHAIYDAEAPAVLQDPAAALQAYGGYIATDEPSTRNWARSVARDTPDAVTRALELLEMERGALRSLTSCAWFFDDIGGLETVQVLRYAAWVIALTGTEAVRLEQGFLTRLAPALSNDPRLGSGRDIYLAQAKPPVPPAAILAAGLAAVRRFAPGAPIGGGWTLEGPDDDARLINRRTGRQTRCALTLERDELSIRIGVRSPALATPLVLGLPDLAEGPRAAIGAAFRQEALNRWLDPDEQTELAAGAGLELVLRRALRRAVGELDSATGTRATVRATALLTLLEQFDAAIPFDVQTDFYRIWMRHEAGDAKLSALAHRLGFSATIAENATDQPTVQ